MASNPETNRRRGLVNKAYHDEVWQKRAEKHGFASEQEMWECLYPTINARELAAICGVKAPETIHKRTRKFPHIPRRAKGGKNHVGSSYQSGFGPKPIDRPYKKWPPACYNNPWKNYLVPNL